MQHIKPPHIPDGKPPETVDLRKRAKDINRQQIIDSIGARAKGFDMKGIPEKLYTELNKWSPEYNMLISGPVGVGKTMALQMLMDRAWKMNWKYWEAVNLAKRLIEIDRTTYDNPWDYNEAMNSVDLPRILFLDDLNTADETMTPAQVKRLADYLDRIEHSTSPVTIVAVTNLTAGQVKAECRKIEQGRLWRRILTGEYWTITIPENQRICETCNTQNCTRKGHRLFECSEWRRR